MAMNISNSNPKMHWYHVFGTWIINLCSRPSTTPRYITIRNLNIWKVWTWPTHDRPKREDSYKTLHYVYTHQSEKCVSYNIFRVHSHVWKSSSNMYRIVWMRYCPLPSIPHHLPACWHGLTSIFYMKTRLTIAHVCKIQRTRKICLSKSEPVILCAHFWRETGFQRECK